jgi:hypothetical protein
MITHSSSRIVATSIINDSDLAEHAKLGVEGAASASAGGKEGRKEGREGEEIHIQYSKW